MTGERDETRRGMEAATNATKANLDMTDETMTQMPSQTSGRRQSLMDSIKEALKPGDVRAAEQRRMADPDEGPVSRKLESMMPGSNAHEEPDRGGLSGHIKPGMMEAMMTTGSAASAEPRGGRNRSSGFMDHLMGRSRSQDNGSGILGFRSEKEQMRRNSGSDDGSDENYRFGQYSTEKARGRRGSSDMPRISAFDTQGPLGHQYSVRC